VRISARRPRLSLGGLGIPSDPFEVGFAPFTLDARAVRHDHVQLEGGSLVLDGDASAGRDGTYQILLRGVQDSLGNPGVTAWVEVDWVADVPAGTTLQVRARSTNSPDLSSPAWAAATSTPWGSVSPLVLQDLLLPNVLVQNSCDMFQAINSYLLVEVELHAAAARPTPRLQFLKVWFTGGHCEG
jgi:hypothetical protein